MAADRTVAIGFAMFFPAISGAERGLARTDQILLVQAGGRKHSDRACYHTCLIGKISPKHVLGQNDVKLARIVDDLHRTVVDQHML